MRRGLDFAWSRPGVKAILSGGFSFVVRYHSYDTSGKNLTRAEADAYRAVGIDVVSNWEYTIDAALKGFGQGQRDAENGQGQHLACGGDGLAPIYFSVDINATEAQQPAIDAYLHGCASVIGAGRVGVYGGYWVVKRCLDNRSAAWGWQTYAWSGGRWDPRAVLRQVLNGATVGGASVDINETDRANFGQWYAPGDPAERPVWTGDDMPKFFRVDQGGLTGVTNGPTWSHLPSDDAVDAALRIWGQTRADIIAINEHDLVGCGVQVPWPTGAAGAGPTHDELVEAAFEGAQKAENQ